MIDLLVAECLLAALATLLVRRLPPHRRVQALLGASFVLHGIALIALFGGGPPRVWASRLPSAARAAKVPPGAAVETVRTEPVPSLGSLAVLLQGAGESLVRVGGVSYTATNHAGALLPWRALDSYFFEEATDGLLLLPRQPVLAPALQLIENQVGGLSFAGIRVVKAGGRSVNTAEELLGALGGVPIDGAVPLRIMAPTPDNGEMSVLVSPGALPEPSRALESNGDRFGRYFGFFGFGVVLHHRDGRELPAQLDTADARPLAGPSALRRAMARERGALVSTTNGSSVNLLPTDFAGAWVRPRLALLPWARWNLPVSWLLGFPGNMLRHVLALRHVPALVRNWATVPKQYYLLDDAALSVPGYLPFAASSLLACLALAILLGICLRRRRLPWVSVVAIAMLLRFAAMFVVH